jgi:hypothetical protein
VHQQFHQGRALQFGKGRSPPLIASFFARSVYLFGVGQAEANPIEGDQTQASITGRSADSGNRTQHSLQQISKHFEGQSLSAFAQSAFGHLDSQQPEQMFAEGSSQTHGEMKNQTGQQLTSIQHTGWPARCVFALFEAVEFIPPDPLQQQSQESATISARDLSGFDASARSRFPPSSSLFCTADRGFGVMRFGVIDFVTFRMLMHP